MWNTYGNQNNVKKKSVYFITILIYCQIALTSPNIYSLLLFSIQNIIELFWLFEMQFISDFYSLAVELIVMHAVFHFHILNLMTSISIASKTVLQQRKMKIFPVHLIKFISKFMQKHLREKIGNTEFEAMDFFSRKILAHN